ncbi:preprotein translocase subunit SecE [Acidobacteria bacterium AH-259-O06]|nr:preprotein translocase subunit SecE [Acidobacteria bacterium AH-259-O06]
MLGVRIPPGLPLFLLMLEKVRDAPKNLITFYGDVKTELKKVTWPSKKEVYGTTTVVIITVFFFGLYLFMVDQLLRNMVSRVFQFFR